MTTARTQPGEQAGDGYFLYHSIGMYQDKSADMAAALADFAMGWGRYDDAHWQRALTMRQQFIDAWRALIRAPEGSLTTAENVTGALHSLIGALPAHHLRGKQVLIAGDCFPSLHFLLTGMASRLGFTLVTVPIRPGESSVRDEDMIANWSGKVGVALLTWVTSTSSTRCDLSALVAHGREMGSLIGVDITQAAGLLPFDVNDPAVDFAISTSLKWLCGSPGAGVLQVAPNLLSTCRPELRGWFSQDDIFSWDLDKFAYAPDARRFDNGTPSLLAAIASLPALQWHARQDAAKLVVHNRTLCAHILDGIGALGLTAASPVDPARRGGSIMIQLPESQDPKAVLTHLRERHVFADHRGQTLRLSPGFVTTQDGVDHMLDGLRAALKA